MQLQDLYVYDEHGALGVFTFDEEEGWMFTPETSTKFTSQELKDIGDKLFQLEQSVTYERH